MKIAIGNSITYKDADASVIHGIGVVKSITEIEYTILWSRRGSKRYRRDVLDQRLDVVFQWEDKQASAHREGNLRLGAAKSGISFNEGYDRAKVKSLCETFQFSGAPRAIELATSLTKELLRDKFEMRTATKTVLRELAEFCGSEMSNDAGQAARQISQELFFGYVIQESDFHRRAVKAKKEKQDTASA
jgi:hypothetical protein